MSPLPRRLLLAGAGVAAAGGGWLLWQRRAVGPLDDVWDARFERPDGRPLALAALRGAPLVLNFWATWCPPCVQEMPEIDRFARDFAARGVRVVGLALDDAAPVRAFLQRAPVGYDIGIAGFAGVGWLRRFGNESGGLPFTVFIDRAGRLAARRAGVTSYLELAGWSLAS